MATAKAIEVVQPKPPMRVQLDLSIEEAVCVAQVCGMIGNTGPVRDKLTCVFIALTDIPRVGNLRFKLSDKILNDDRRHTSLEIGDVSIPKED